MTVILGKEDETTEFKDSMSQLDKGIKSLAAMLNRHQHGYLYIGIDDDGIVKGIDVGSRTMEDIRNRVRDLIKPQVVPEISVNTTETGESYVSIHATGYDIPYSYDGRYYIRNAASDESAGPEVVAQMVMARGIDPLRCQRSDVQDLTFDTLFGILSDRGKHPRNDAGFYRSHGMMDEHGRFTLTAYLVSDQSNVQMQVVTFDGTDRSAVSSRTDYGGRCLIRSAIDILSRISSYAVTEVDLSKGVRIEQNLFDMDSFREAWINACVHNAWRAMVPPSVMLFDDRMEIVSYGRIPFPSSLEEFFAGDSRPVNRSLFELFTLAGLTEQSGHGIPTIVKKYGREAFNITDNGVVVTIPFAFTPDYVKARKESEIRKAGMDPKLRFILIYLGSNPEAKLSDVAEAAEMSLSSVKKAVASLKEDGFLRNDGTNRNSRWVVL